MRELRKDDVDLQEVLADSNRDLLSNINCISIGKITAFDNATQSAEIQIQFKRTINSKLYSYPLLVDCPCVVISGGGASLRMPIKAGDECLVLFGDRDIDNWFESGTETPLNSDRLHSLSDGIALVGIRSLQNSISGFTADEAGIVADDATKLRFENAGKNLKTLIDALIDEISNATIIIASGSSAGTYPIANKAAILALKIQFAELLK